MVEKLHTAGWLPNLYEPLKHIGEKIADWFAPKSEASATKEHYHIDIELPGVSADDIDISLHNGSLTVRGEKRFERERKGRSYFFSEREYGAFQRTFRLPPDADQGDIDADFENGVLTVRIAKRGAEKATERKISITKRD